VQIQVEKATEGLVRNRHQQHNKCHQPQSDRNLGHATLIHKAGEFFFVFLFVTAVFLSQRYFLSTTILRSNRVPLDGHAQCILAALEEYIK
jgi:hypothetical protein